MATLSLDSTEHEILTQLFIAFGQGAGTMPVAAQVIAAATEDYLAAIHENVAGWRSIELQALESARGLGRLAAHLALQDGRDVVMTEHYQGARNGIRPRIDCPFC